MDIIQIKNKIHDIRQTFKTNKRQVTSSRQARRKILRILKGKRDINRFKNRRNNHIFNYNLPVPSAPVIENYIITPSAPYIENVLE